jgi:hypothetical protein
MLEENEVISAKTTTIGADSNTRPKTNKKKKKHPDCHLKKEHNSKDGKRKETEETNIKSHQNITACKNQSITKSEAVPSSKREKMSIDTHHAHTKDQTARQKRLQRQLEEQEETSVLSTSILSIPSVKPGAYSSSFGVAPPHANDVEDIESLNTVIDSTSPITATVINEDELRRQILHDTPVVYAVRQEVQHPEEINRGKYVVTRKWMSCFVGILLAILVVIVVTVISIVFGVTDQNETDQNETDFGEVSCGSFLTYFYDKEPQLICTCESKTVTVECNLEPAYQATPAPTSGPEVGDPSTIMPNPDATYMPSTHSTCESKKVAVQCNLEPAYQATPAPTSPPLANHPTNMPDPIETGMPTARPTETPPATDPPTLFDCDSILENVPSGLCECDVLLGTIVCGT